MGIDDLKKEDKDKKNILFCVSSNLIAFSFCNAFWFFTFKLVGFGFPIIRDVDKKYEVVMTKKDNHNRENKQYRYLSKSDLKKYKKFYSRLYMKSNYLYEDVWYSDVIVYSLNKNVNVDDVLDNYQDYMIKGNIIDFYKTSNNFYEDNIEKDVSVSVLYCDVNRISELDKVEKAGKNIIVSVVYFSFIGSIGYMYGNKLLGELEDINENNKDNVKILKKKK